MGDFQLFGDDDDDDDLQGVGNDLTQRLGLIVSKWEVETPGGHKLRTDGSRRDL